MKTLDTWFEEYAVSHQNKTNIAIHFICVPAIFFSIVGLIMSIPTGFLTSIIPGDNPFIENWAFITSLFLILFYVRFFFNYFCCCMDRAILWASSRRKKTFCSARFTIFINRTRLGNPKDVWKKVI